MFPSFRIVSDGPSVESVNVISSQTSYAFQSMAVEAPSGASHWDMQGIPPTSQAFALPEDTENQYVDNDPASEL